MSHTSKESSTISILDYLHSILLFLAIMITSAWILQSFSEGFLILLLGVLLIPFALIFYFLGKKFPLFRRLCLIFNAISCGACSGAVLIGNSSLEILLIIVAIIPALAVTLLCRLLLLKSHRPEKICGIFLCASFLLAILSLLGWAFTTCVLFSLTYFSMLACLFFFGFLYLNMESKGNVPEESLLQASFSISIIIAIIAWFVLCIVGEDFDFDFSGFEGDGSFIGSRKTWWGKALAFIASIGALLLAIAMVLATGALLAMAVV